MLSLFTALSMTACHTAKKSNEAAETGQEIAQTDITDKKWILTELQGKPVADRINGKEPYLQLQKNGSRYSAHGGCNGMGGTYQIIKENKILFSLGASTLMACENMEIEQGLSHVLKTADHYSVEGNALILGKGSAPLARFRLAGAPAGEQGLGGNWELIYISGPRIAFEGLYPHKKPTLSLSLEDHKAHGNSSCNNYNTSFSLDGKNISFSDPMSTKMACEGMGESTFFNTLKKVDAYDLVDGKLELSMDGIAIMRFAKK